MHSISSGTKLESFSTLVFTFAALVRGAAIVTRFAVLAAWSHRVVEAAQTFARQAVTGIAVIWVNVVVAGTLATAGTWQCQIAMETRAASVAAWTCESHIQLKFCWGHIHRVHMFNVNVAKAYVNSIALIVKLTLCYPLVAAPLTHLNTDSVSLLFDTCLPL